MVKPTKADIKAIKEDMKKSIIIRLDLLSDKERLEIINRYCKYCGSKDNFCNCGNLLITDEEKRLGICKECK